MAPLNCNYHNLPNVMYLAPRWGIATFSYLLFLHSSSVLSAFVRVVPKPMLAAFSGPFRSTTDRLRQSLLFLRDRLRMGTFLRLLLFSIGYALSTLPLAVPRLPFEHFYEAYSTFVFLEETTGIPFATFPRIDLPSIVLVSIS